MFLANFKNDLSRPPIPQQQGLEWLARQHGFRSDIEEDKLIKMLNRFGCGPSQIGQRRTWLPEFMQPPMPGLFLKPEGREQPNMQQRAEVYQKQISLAVENLYGKVDQAPDHLLHVSCTGYVSPSVAQKLVLQNKWNTVVQHLYHMGCYAAIPALRTAHGLIATEPQAKVDILHTEFCTLHMNLQSTNPEQLVVQSLFADACIHYQATQLAPSDGPSLQLLATHEILIPESSEDMTWGLDNFGFAMTLSREVPHKIGQHLKSFLDHLFKKANLPISQISNLTAAVHPGGPKIIDAVKTILEFKEEQVATSRKILFENGNMSSATVPFIWKDVLENAETIQNPYVLSLAFGPGLTIAGSLLCLNR